MKTVIKFIRIPVCCPVVLSTYPGLAWRPCSEWASTFMFCQIMFHLWSVYIMSTFWLSSKTKHILCMSPNNIWYFLTHSGATSDIGYWIYELQCHEVTEWKRKKLSERKFWPDLCHFFEVNGFLFFDKQQHLFLFFHICWHKQPSPDPIFVTNPHMFKQLCMMHHHQCSKSK